MPEVREDKAVKQIASEDPLALPDIESVLDRLLSLGENGVVKSVDTLICQAVHHRASDLHLEPWRDCLSLRYRLDGVLHEIAMLPKKYQEKVVARVKVLANMIPYQKEIPQDGRIDGHKDRLNRALRASTFPTIHGEKVVIRILDSQQDLLRLDSLGFLDQVVIGLRKLVFKPQGTLLLTGPSSAGKTTTIYALLRELMVLHASSRHIVTVEDPVEYQLGRVSQSQISPQLGFTFEMAFRALLRQDPDVIMIGEIRDPETARTAIQAGLTGHLVISTIHSGSSAGVFTRLLDMGIEPFLAASSVSGVLSQRLVRSNCIHCKQPYKPEPALRVQYGLPERGVKYRRGIGCEECRGIGFRGRTAIGELLKVDDVLADLVLTRARTSVLHETALETGMTTLLEHGVQKAAEGITTIEELRLAIPPPDIVENAPKRRANSRPKKKNGAQQR
ncbi:MAG: GspE/PulE family protein [Candidatus Hydrogenedentota bacterium]